MIAFRAAHTVLVLTFALATTRCGSEFQAPRQAMGRESPILFDSNRDGKFEIYIMDTDGSNQQRLTDSSGSESPAWSPDRSKIAFTTAEGSIAVMDAGGANPQVVTRTEGEESGGPAWSPDGMRIAQRESMLEAMQGSLNDAQPRRPTTKFRRYEHPLIPDRERLYLFLAGMLDFLNPLHYRVAAAFEIVPAWLRFMESRGLIDADERARGIRDLAGMADDLRPAFDKFPDPALPLALERWRNDAAKALPQ